MTDIPQKKIILNKDELYQLYWEQMLSQKKIADIIGCSIDTVRQNLRDYNIPIHIPSYHAHEQKVFLNNLQLDYLYGAMLGDGCLYKAKKGINSQLIYTSKSYQHVEYVSKPFESILYKACK